jgi:hypothetical protein
MSERSTETAQPKKRGRGLTALIRWLHIYVSVLGFLALLFFAVTGFTLNHAEWLCMGQEDVREMQGSIEPGLLSGEGGNGGPPEEEFAAPALPIEEVPVPVEEMAAPVVEMAPAVEQVAAPLEETAAPVEEMGAPIEEMGAPMEEMGVPAGGPGEAVADAVGVDKLAVAETLRSRHALRGAVTEFAVDQYQCFVSFRGPGYSADAFIDRATGQYELTEARLGVVALLNDLHTGRSAGRAWPWVIDLSALIMAIASITGLALVLLVKRRRRSGVLAAVLGSIAVFVVYLLWVP